MAKKVNVTWDDLYNIKFRNTRELRKAAETFEEKGKYCIYSEGDPLREDWWEEEERKCIYGDWFPIGPAGELIYIPGYYYFYINYCPILHLGKNQDIDNEEYQKQINVDEESGDINFVNYDLIRADRIEGFPNFWDGDYWHFKYIDDAERLAKFGIELKRRGVGASFKAGGMANRNYFLIPQSRSFLIANEKDFLLGGDGVLQKAWDMMYFIDRNTDWSKRRQYISTQMERRASFRESFQGVEIEQGYMSTIIGRTTKNDPGKVRGIRGKLIYLEEAGKDPYFLEKFRILVNSVKQQRKVFGFILGSGTGGQEGSDFKGLTEIFYHTDGYNCFGIPNKWDRASEHKLCGYFWPVHLNSEGFMDPDGNSDLVTAAAFEREERERISNNVTERHTLVRHKAENPFNPKEATLNMEKSVLPTAELEDHLNDLETSPLRLHYGRNGRVSKDMTGSIKFKEDEKAVPIDSFPWDKKHNESGCTVIYDSPIIMNGKVPDNLYLLVNDPYYHDQSTGPSLGASYIYKKINNISTFRMDTIVAAYVGRPKTLNDYLRNMFLLAEYYNAKISFEIDRGRSILDHARQSKKLNMLQQEFEFKYNTQIPKSKIKRGYGFKMSSGMNDPVRTIGEQYLADWLLRERSIDEDGNLLLNLHLIYDRALIQELLAYGDGGNYDRVDAMIQLMYFIKEVAHVPAMEDYAVEKGSFFDPQRIAKFYQHEKWY